MIAVINSNLHELLLVLTGNQQYDVAKHHIHRCMGMLIGKGCSVCGVKRGNATM